MSVSHLRSCVLLVIVVAATAAIAQSPARYDDAVLARKKMFADRQRAALGVPFSGVRARAGVEPGLFPIRATAVSTEPIRLAAAAFIDSLSPTQLIRTMFAVDDAEWRRWSNVDNGLYVRQGVSLKEMPVVQREAAMALVRASLSPNGLGLTQAIMKTDQTLREINNDIVRYDSDLYFFTIMGHPSSTEPWGWQIDGHHLVINYFVLEDQVVMTPVFLGAEPAVAATGRYAGNAVLQVEQDGGLAFMRSLTQSQRDAATLRRDKTENDIQAEADRDNLVLDYRGVRAAALAAPQKAQLLELVGLYVNNMREDQARVRMTEVAAHLDDTYFAWSGGTSDADVFYYRIHSPVVLFEFDHQRPIGTRRIYPPDRPTKAHIHVIVRTPNGNDYGKELLRQHLAAHPH